MTKNMRNHNYNDKRLVRVLADTTNKRVLMGLICFAFSILLCLYLVAIFAVPNTFVELEGIEECDSKSNFKGLCHRLHFKDSTQWTAYIGRLHKKNQFLLIGGEFFRSEIDSELDTEIDFEIEV